MRLLTSILIIGQLMACVRPPSNDCSEKTPYRPHPSVEVSMFSAEDGVVSAYVRHSSGAVLVHLSKIADDEHEVRAPDLRYVLTLSSTEDINFSPTRYENFDRSFDVFQDGRIVLVPLSENGKAGGMFVNLLSGKRYFFAPSVSSSESLATIRSLGKSQRNVTVIIPEDRRAYERVALFPEFRR